jgi:hypothetical protein
MKKYLSVSFRLMILFSLSVISISALSQEESQLIPRTFTSTRIGMTQGVDLPATGELHFSIAHRFGEIKGGLYDIFGLDLATIRFGFDYGLSDNFSVGIGRSSFEKTYDINTKLSLLRQSPGGFPLSVTGNLALSVNTLKNIYPDENDGLAPRSSVSGQIIIARSQGDVSIQVSPLLFRNSYETRLDDELILFALPLAASVKITKRMAINGQYIPIFNKAPFMGDNPLSLGFDIDTGGHQFQLLFSNSTGMFEKTLLTNTDGDWALGRIYFGFNLVRVFYFQ